MTKKPLALVTGATIGIGRAVTLVLTGAGYDVMALGRDHDALNALAAHPGVTPHAVDVTDRPALLAVLDGVAFDVVVNNAGVIPPVVPFDTLDLADIDTALAVNLTAAIVTTRLVLPGMRARQSGHVSFTGSTAGHAAFPNMAVYGATKAAISSFAAALRCDIAGTGVRITEIVAGRVQTNLYHAVLPDDARADMYDAFDAVRPDDVAHMLLSVLEMPAHVDVACFDILPTAQYVNGAGYVKKED